MSYTNRSKWSLALILMMCVAMFLLTTTNAAARKGDVLVSFDFENGFKNTGLWGGEAVSIEYARGQGPKVTPGVGLGGSAGLDFMSASRSGGLESNLAGGILSFEHPRHDYPRNFTIALWFYLPEPRGLERLFDPVTITDRSTQKRPRLDLYVQQHEKLVLETRFIHGEDRPRGNTEILGGRWYFVAASVDRGRSRVSYYLGGQQEGEFSLEIEFSYSEQLTMGNELRLGNADMIRPFKGYMDMVKIIEGALNKAEVEALWREGLELLNQSHVQSATDQGEEQPAEVISVIDRESASSFQLETMTGSEQSLQFWFMEPKDVNEPYGNLEFRSAALRYVANAWSGGGVPMSIKAIVPQPATGVWPANEPGWWLYSSSERGEGAQAVWTIDRYFTTDGVRLYGPDQLYEQSAEGWLGMYAIAHNPQTGEMIFLRHQRGDNVGLPVYAFGSRDGITWQRLSGFPIYRDHDAVSLYWNPLLGRYVAYQTTYQQWSKKIADNIGDGTRRVLHIRTSQDGLRWDPSFDVSYWNRPTSRAPEERLIVPNELDSPGLEFYQMTVFQYGDRFVAMVLNYEPSPQNVNPVDYISGHGPFMSAEWWTSDDGINWRRPYQGQDALGDAPSIVTHPPLTVGDEMRFLIARNTYAIDADRLAGVYSLGNAEFSTPLFEMGHEPLFLNVSALYRDIPAHGSVWGRDSQAYVMVEIQDQFGNPIPGYEREKAAYVNVDDRALRLTWDGKDATALAGKTVKLKFFFRDATIYGLKAGSN